MVVKPTLHELKLPKGDRVILYCLDNDDNVKFVLTDRFGLCDSFCLYEVVNGMCENLWYARTPQILLERLYHERGILVK